MVPAEVVKELLKDGTLARNSGRGPKILPAGAFPQREAAAVRTDAPVPQVFENRVLRLRGSMLSDSVAFSEGRVRGFFHRASGDGRDGLVLTHGAGGNARMALLEAVARAFADAGICVLRCDLPFRLRRPYGPPSPANAAADRMGLKEAAAVMRGLVPGRVFLGGQSYGGRQASVLAAEDGAVTEGLLLLSYPLHPPGKTQQARTSHWPALRTPALFVHGSRDPFASCEELRAAVALIPALAQIVEIEGRRPRSRAGRLERQGDGR